MANFGSLKQYVGGLGFLLPSLLTLVTLFSGAAWANELPDEDPTREWRGREYADVLYTKFRQIHPEIPLRVDLKELLAFKNLESEPAWSAKQAIENFKLAWKSFEGEQFRPRSMAAARELFSPSVAELIHTLEFGDPIQSVDMQRGYDLEWALKKWILKQKDNSIYPDDMMIEALRLSGGSVISAWAAAWNVVRDEWQYASTRNYDKLRPKFKSLTGERHLWKGGAHYAYVNVEDQVAKRSSVYLPTGESFGQETKQQMQMVITKRGDEYSYLYHRLGVELLAITVAQRTKSSTAGWGLGTIGAIGEFLKYTKTAGLERENKKRIANDLAAASSGARFFALIEKNSKAPLAISKARTSHYLRSNPRKYGPLYQLPKDRPSHYYGASIERDFLSPVMGIRELKLRFAHASEYDRNIFDPIVLTTGDDYERLHRGLADYIESGAKDSELNMQLKRFAAGVSAVPEKMDVDVDLDLNRFENMLVVREAAPEFSFEEAEEKLLRHVEKAVAAATKFERKKEIQRLLNPPVEMCRAAFSR